MPKVLNCLATVVLASMLAAPIAGCQQNREPPKEKDKGLDVHIDAGGAKVDVEAKKKADEKAGHIDVEVRPGGESK